MVRKVIGTARAAGASGVLLVRGASTYLDNAVFGACPASGARFSCVLTKTPVVSRAIAAIHTGGAISGTVPRGRALG